jgi:carbon storage regulator
VKAPDAVNHGFVGVFQELRTKESSMLVLSRKKNESIIVVVEIRGDKVRLGVEAPKEVPVHRNEVYEAIRRNQQKPESAEPTVAEHDAT